MSPVELVTLRSTLTCGCAHKPQATKQLGLHSHPDNHGAICSDPAERLAHTSQGMDDSGYRAPGNHSNVFPVNLDLPDASQRRPGDIGAEPAAITESARATSSIVPL